MKTTQRRLFIDKWVSNQDGEGSALYSAFLTRQWLFSEGKKTQDTVSAIHLKKRNFVKHLK